MTDKETPVVHAEHAYELWRGRHLVGYEVKVKCPFCDKFHFHGIGEGSRLSHCLDRERRGTYYITYNRIERKQI